MEQDSLGYDSLGIRPLPQWLIKQKEGLNTYQPPQLTMKEDRSLYTSFALTGIIVVLIITILTIYFLRKDRKKTT